MSFASIQNGVQQVLPVGGWRSASEWCAPCNASFATIDERTHSGTVQPVSSVEAPAAASAACDPAHGGPRPFWQYLADSNRRDLLERAAQRPAGREAEAVTLSAASRSTQAANEPARLASPAQAAEVSPTRQRARSSYSGAAGQSTNRIIDVVA